MQRTNLRLTPDQRRILRDRSAATGRPVAAIVRDAIDQWLERTARIERALAAAGGFRSGHSDTSENHDDVIVDAIEARFRR